MLHIINILYYYVVTIRSSKTVLCVMRQDRKSYLLSIMMDTLGIWRGMNGHMIFKVFLAITKATVKSVH